MSPQEVLEAAQAQVPALSLATVYRNLKLLQDAGEIATVTLPGDSPRYEPAGHAHHHHFQCTTCHRVFDVHACPGERLVSSIALAGVMQLIEADLPLEPLAEARYRPSGNVRIPLFE